MKTYVAIEKTGNSRQLLLLLVATLSLGTGLALGLLPYSLTIRLIILIPLLLLLLLPRIALYLIIATSPFFFIIDNYFDLAGLIIISSRFTLIDILTMVAAGGVAFRLLSRSYKDTHLNLTAIDALCLGWLALSLVSLFHGLTSGYEAAFRSARGPLLFVLYFVAAYEINSPKRLQELKAVILFSSPILGIIGLLGATGYLDTYFPDLSVGLVGDSLTRPNFFAEPALAIPNVIFLTIMLKYLKPRSLIIWLTTTIGLILNLALLMLSVTRGFWLGMTVAFLAVVVILLKERKASLPGVMQVVIVVAVGVFLVQLLMLTWQHVDLLGASWDRLQQALTGEDVQSVDYRLSEFKAYFKSFLESPIFGQGYGSPVSFSFIQSAGFAHNEYIWVLETTGIIGFALLGSFLFLALRQALAHTHLAKKIELKESLDLTLAVTIIGYMVVSLTSPEFTNPTTVPLLASLIGISVNCRTKLGPST